MSRELRLCLNCLRSDEPVEEVPIGHELGSQRDPYWNTIDLCETCKKALEEGDLVTFYHRFRRETLVTRQTKGGNE